MLKDLAAAFGISMVLLLAFAGAAAVPAGIAIGLYLAVTRL